MMSWRLENACEIRKEAPYTFYKPSDNIIDLFIPGEAAVKLMFLFESDDPEAPCAERMWVILESVDRDGNYSGILDNDPFYIKDLKAGDLITFRKEHIIQYYIFDELNVEDPLSEMIERFTKKCFVSNHIMKEGYKVGRIYREYGEDEDYSGWTIMSNYETQEYVDDSNNLQYILLGKVLNIDDSFIHLLEESVGSEFVKNDMTGDYSQNS
ncbi:hypothetical protein TH53_01755 [Pedobacter lusitanus]|uniref:DUF2185 domain-containing protein n=1 Tax=Pedobacter lusitanus TaxID=1503925 RepID=A0A0D0GNQ1_9SPHI|nr:DUF2185 domain-containing protein [Pedobacter lusitanus]KIO78832.1 hypothetical protein TH53_01755 [Pedobacter lusitanus]